MRRHNSSISWRRVCGALHHEKPPPIFFEKENAPRPVEKKCFCFGVWAWITNGRAKASLRSQPPDAARGSAFPSRSPQRSLRSTRTRSATGTRDSAVRRNTPGGMLTKPSCRLPQNAISSVAITKSRPRRIVPKGSRTNPGHRKAAPALTRRVTHTTAVISSSVASTAAESPSDNHNKTTTLVLVDKRQTPFSPHTAAILFV